MKTDYANGEVECSLDRGILTVILNRPRKANSITSDMLHALRQISDAVSVDYNLKAIVLTGAGEKVFSGGVDLKEVESLEINSQEEIDYYDLWASTTSALSALPIPLIALINGPCVAGGLSLSLCCDMRFALPNAFLSYPRIPEGFLPGRFNLTKLTRLIGPSRTKAILLTARRVLADEAVVWGLVEEVLSPNSWEAEFEKILEPIRSSDPRILAATKILTDNVDDNDVWIDSKLAVEQNDDEALIRVRRKPVS